MTSILQLLFYNGSFTEALLQRLSLSCSNPTLDKVGKRVALRVAPLPHHSVWAKVSGRPPPLDDSAARRSHHARRLPASLHHN